MDVVGIYKETCVCIHIKTQAQEGKEGHVPCRFDQLGPVPDAGAAILPAVGA